MRQRLLNTFGGEALPHTFVLAVCLAILGAGLILRQPAPNQKALTIAGWRVPPLCMVKRQFGVDCPGCGLTRSVTACVQGDMQRALTWHRLGPLAVLYILLQALRHGAWLFLVAWRPLEPRWGRYLDRSIWLMVILLPLNYVAKIFGY